MFGEPEDVEGQCNARLYIADNYGDNHATMRCQLELGHPETHRENYTVSGVDGVSQVIVNWEKDEREDNEKESDRRI